MKEIDPNWTRSLTREAPKDEFYAVIPWAAEWLWLQKVYTWEPAWAFITFTMKMTKDALVTYNPINPFEIERRLWDAAYGFRPQCPGIIEGI